MYICWLLNGFKATDVQHLTEQKVSSTRNGFWGATCTPGLCTQHMRSWAPNRWKCRGRAGQRGAAPADGCAWCLRDAAWRMELEMMPNGCWEGRQGVALFLSFPLIPQWGCVHRGSEASTYCYSNFRVTRKKVISGNKQYLVSISIQKHRWEKRAKVQCRSFSVWGVHMLRAHNSFGLVNFSLTVKWGRMKSLQSALEILLKILNSCISTL